MEEFGIEWNKVLLRFQTGIVAEPFFFSFWVEWTRLNSLSIILLLSVTLLGKGATMHWIAVLMTNVKGGIYSHFILWNNKC